MSALKASPKRNALRLDRLMYNQGAFARAHMKEHCHGHS
jgi:hypothetical protein